MKGSNVVSSQDNQSHRLYIPERQKNKETILVLQCIEKEEEEEDDFRVRQTQEKEKKMWLRLAVSPMHVDVLDCARPITQQTRDGEEMWMFLCCIQENISPDRIERKRNECEQRCCTKYQTRERLSLSLSLLVGLVVTPVAHPQDVCKGKEEEENLVCVLDDMSQKKTEIKMERKKEKKYPSANETRRRRVIRLQRRALLLLCNIIHRQKSKLSLNSSFSTKIYFLKRMKFQTKIIYYELVYKKNWRIADIVKEKKKSKSVGREISHLGTRNEI